MENEIKCYDLPEDFDVEQFPYTAKYIRLHGTLKCMSVWDLKEPYKSCEEVYKECLKQGITWEKLLNHSGYNPKIIL